MPEAHMPEAPLPGSTMLEGKVALVSGIGPGMGRDISLLLARARRRRRARRPAHREERGGRRGGAGARSPGRGRAARHHRRRRPARRRSPGRSSALGGARHPREQRLPGRQPQGASSTRRSRSGGQTMDVNLWGTLADDPRRGARHDRARRRLDRDDQLDVDAPHRADLRRLRGVEGRARDRHQDARPRARARTASG